MTDSSGNLSVDFLVGFTIFMVAFIWVATLVPNLFLGVSAHGIDFDAVAYRTGVILAEDSGATILNVTTPWEVQPDSAKDNVERFGLAVSKETPNILSETKVKRFFNTTVFSYPDDYRRKVIFGNYPYSFNISLKDVEESGTRYIGDVRPDNYGFIRREVKIKHDSSNATLDQTDYYIPAGGYGLNNSQNSTYHDFAIVINTTKLLYGNITNPLVNPNIHDAYEINPTKDNIVIVLDDLNKDYPKYDFAHKLENDGELNVTDVTVYNYINGLGMVELTGPSYENFIWNDTETTPGVPPFPVQRCVTYVFPPGFFAGTDASMGSAIYINTTFHIPATTNFPQGKPFLNTTRTHPFDYSYNPTDVTQPYLTDAVMEVAVW